MNCEYCQSPVHVWFQCPKKPDGWKPARLAKKSTAAQKGVPISRKPASPGKPMVEGQGEDWNILAGTQALPVDTNAAQESYGAEGLRPNDAPAKFDKKTWQRNYMKIYMRKRRAKEREGI